MEKMDIEDNSALLGDRCLLQNQVMTKIKPVRRLQNPLLQEGMIFMDGGQQNIYLTHRDAEIEKEIKKSSQIQIL
jgi:hypothetical protein